MSIEDFKRAERVTVELQQQFIESIEKDLRHMQHFAHMESGRYRHQLILIVAFVGLGINTLLAVYYSGTAHGEAFGLVGNGFGMVTALVNVAGGLPVQPTEDLATENPFVVRVYRTSRRLYYLSFPLVALWLGLIVWRAVALWRLW